MALFRLIDAPAPPGVGASCLRRRFPRHTCQACRDLCPVRAISFSEKGAVLDSETCLRCGHCLFVCPADALENLQPPQRHYRDDALIAPFSVQVAGVDELLMWHSQYGIRHIELDIDAHPGWALAVAALNMQLDALNEPQWQIIPPVLKGVDVLRRRWLRVSDKTQKSVAVRASRQLRRRAFAEISEYRLTLDPASCTLCRACERVCPQKAIAFTEEELTLATADCTGCGSCAVVCPTRSLTCVPQTGAPARTRFRYTRKTCSDCQNVFSTFKEDERRCPICQRHCYGMRY